MSARGLIEERNGISRIHTRYFSIYSRFAREGGARGGPTKNGEEIFADTVRLIFRRMRESSLRLGEKPDDIISTFGFARRSATFN